MGASKFVRQLKQVFEPCRIVFKELQVKKQLRITMFLQREE